MFVTLEGTEGSGKSTAAAWLAERLRARGFEVLSVREPGGTPTGEAVRGILLGATPPSSPLAALLLFNAARAELVETTIRPALATGCVVICDRFTDSTLAYQGFGAGIPIDVVSVANAVAAGGLIPDLTVLFDLDASEGLARKASTVEWNAMDALSLSFHERVRAGFLKLVAQEPARWQVIDASQDREAVRTQLERCVLSRTVYDATTGPAGHCRS